MKLYEVKSKKQVIYTFALEENWCPKEHLKDRCWLEADLRTLKEKEFPKGRLEVTDLDTCHYIFFNGELFVNWDDSANSNYPEDLTWDRDISMLIDQVEKLKDAEYVADLSGILEDE